MKFITALCMTALMATSAHAKGGDHPLWQVERVNNDLLVIGIALAVNDYCTTIGNNRPRGLFYLLGLQNYAVGLGFSRKEINEFVDDPVEQAYLEERVKAYMAQRGHALDGPDSLCEYGYQQIEEGTFISRFLREDG